MAHELICGFSEKLDASQVVYVKSMRNYKVTVTNSPAGTGKTTLAVAEARAKGKPLHYFFSPVEERKMGFRTGSQSEKESAYLQPLYDALVAIGEDPMQAIFSHDPALAKRQQKAWVHAMSHTFRRGTNLSGGGTVIFDEVQNATRQEVKKVISRCHDDMTVVLIGNMIQCDIDERHSCLPRLLEFYATREYANIVTLENNYRGIISRDAEYL